MWTQCKSASYKISHHSFKEMTKGPFQVSWRSKRSNGEHVTMLLIMGQLWMIIVEWELGNQTCIKTMGLFNLRVNKQHFKHQQLYSYKRELWWKSYVFNRRRNCVYVDLALRESRFQRVGAATAKALDAMLLFRHTT